MSEETEEQKELLGYLKDRFAHKIRGIETLAGFKTFIGNLTKTKIINALKARIQEEIDAKVQSSEDEQAKADELTELKNNLTQYLE